MAASSDKTPVELSLQAYEKASNARKAVTRAEASVVKADSAFAKKVNGLDKEGVAELKTGIEAFHEDQKSDTPADTATQSVIEIV